MSMTMAELRPALLLAMHKAHNSIPDDSADFGFDLFDDVYLKFDLDARRRSVELCAKEFSSQGLIEIEEIPGSDDEANFICSMTAAGIDKAEQLIRLQANPPIEQAGSVMVEGATLHATASTEPISTTFGFAPGSANFGSGTFNSALLNSMPFNGPATARSIAAADRYVSVKDNQEPFGQLARTLTKIRDEFARDHNKGELGALGAAEELLTEIDGTLAHIDRGHVRLGQLTDGLDPALRKVLPYVSAYPGLCKLLNDAVDLIQVIWNAVGKHL